MTGAERLRRIFARSGLQRAATLDGLPAGGTIVLARADWVFDEALIKALARRPGSALTAPDGTVVAAHVGTAEAAGVLAALTEGRPISGLTQLDVEALSYNSALRKREAPVLERLGEGSARQIEARLFKASYKGVTDVVTKYVWPLPARIVTRWCALAGITPNQVTFASLLFVIVAFVLFQHGVFGWGLAAAWIMTFLDTVDGKLARVGLTSSKFGNVFDHGIDLIHPPFWWWAWYAGAAADGLPTPYGPLMLAIVLGGYVVQRIEEGIFMRLFGMHVHAWRRFDSFFRLITARRNPNLVLLSVATMFGRPDLGFVAIALWTAISLVVHTVQIVQALATPRPLMSWLAR